MKNHKKVLMIPDTPAEGIRNLIGRFFSINIFHSKEKREVAMPVKITDSGIKDGKLMVEIEFPSLKDEFTQEIPTGNSYLVQWELLRLLIIEEVNDFKIYD